MVNIRRKNPFYSNWLKLSISHISIIVGISRGIFAKNYSAILIWKNIQKLSNKALWFQLTVQPFFCFGFLSIYMQWNIGINFHFVEWKLMALKNFGHIETHIKGKIDTQFFLLAYTSQWLKKETHALHPQFISKCTYHSCNESEFTRTFTLVSAKLFYLFHN